MTQINPPPLYSIILISVKDKKYIGFINKIEKDIMSVLLLDTVGKMNINIKDNWRILDIKDLQSLRGAFNTYIGRNTPQVILDKYKIFMDTFIIPKK